MTACDRGSRGSRERTDEDAVVAPAPEGRHRVRRLARPVVRPAGRADRADVDGDRAGNGKARTTRALRRSPALDSADSVERRRADRAQANRCSRPVTLYLTETEVSSLLTPADAIPIVEESFRRLAAGNVSNQPRLRLPPNGAPL